MTDEEENIRLIKICDDRFEIIKRAREHIIDATNIESRPEEMQVLDNFLFRCWQMGWLKNDFHQLEKENAELKEKNSILKNDVRVAREDRERLQIKVGKGLQEYIKDCPYSALKYYATSKVVEENEELKSQNEKMKCCGNCKYIEFRYFVENMKVKNMINYCSDCIRFIKKNKKDKWELAE